MATFDVKYLSSIDIHVIDSQKVQTVKSWLTQTTSSFVDAKLEDQILAWAQDTVKNTVQKHLEEPDKHLQNYGDELLCKHFLLAHH